MSRQIDLLNEKRVPKRTIFSIIIYVIEIVIVILLAYAITRYGFVNMEITDENMLPTLEINDEIIVDKISYKVGKVKRSDVVVISEKSSNHTYYTALRVLGLPGEKIVIKDGDVYIDGKKVKEKLEFEEIKAAGLAQNEITLGKNEYFLLGDNRNNCLDSRNETVGNVKRSDILGKAFIKRKPFAFVGSIDNF